MILVTSLVRVESTWPLSYTKRVVNFLSNFKKIIAKENYIKNMKFLRKKHRDINGKQKYLLFSHQ